MRKVKAILTSQLAAVNVGMVGNDLEAVAEAAKATVELLKIAHGTLLSRETKSLAKLAVKSSTAVHKHLKRSNIDQGGGGKGGGIALTRDRGGNGAPRPKAQYGYYGSSGGHNRR
jgi:hypothetical protein